MAGRHSPRHRVDCVAVRCRTSGNVESMAVATGVLEITGGLGLGDARFAAGPSRTGANAVTASIAIGAGARAGRTRHANFTTNLHRHRGAARLALVAARALERWRGMGAGPHSSAMALSENTSPKLRSNDRAASP